MSGRITTPTCAGSAGSATAAEKSVPSAAVRVRVPRSATSPMRGGAGGRLSGSWHMVPFYRDRGGGTARGSALVAAGGGLGRSPEHLGGHLAAGLGEPEVLAVGLVDQPVELRRGQPGLDLRDDPQRLEAAALGAHARGEELEL